MDATKNMIIIRGEFRTASIEECYIDEQSNDCYVRFKRKPKVYIYRKENVLWLTEPTELNPQDCHLIKVQTRTEIKRNTINGIWEFKNKERSYWHVRTSQTGGEDYDDRTLVVIKSCLADIDAKNVFNYLKESASFTELKGEDETNLLRNQYEKIDFIGDSTALATYLNPQNSKVKATVNKSTCIFPFGCNASQQKAVSRAFESQFSIIQGPPGTGKTQTILNIIANILTEKDKSVLVVSNNNSAIQNVLEKMESNNLGFLVAMLGKSENKKAFVANQQEMVIPADMESWNTPSIAIQEIGQANSELVKVFSLQERLALLKEERTQLGIERVHFFNGNEGNSAEISMKEHVGSKQLLQLCNRLEANIDNAPSSFIQKLKWGWYMLKVRFTMGLKGKSLSRNNIPETIKSLQGIYYSAKEEEMNEEEKRTNAELASCDGKALMKKLTDCSKEYLHQKLYERFGNGYTRRAFTENDLWRDSESENVIKEYPVILSTTFSARSSLRNVTYDYVIMDEASQVSVETGALALSVGRNVVIVGDSMQLPNVQTLQANISLDNLFKQFKIAEGYNSSKYSFLESVKQIVKGSPSTLLREHYRCHPRIINFCNQKFYGGNLLIMTGGDTEDPALKAFRTVPGNHARGHVNEREAEVIVQEILPDLDMTETGIIAAYNDQVDLLSQKTAGRVEISTVHKFQGREKESIIIDFVDNQPTSFSDDLNLMNVAVSRAKKQLCLVVTGNELPKNSNIAHLVDYISYNNGIVTESRIRSIFDLLYTSQNEQLLEFLNKHGQISEFASENLTYTLIKEILADGIFLHLDVLFGYPINHLLRDFTLLSPEEENFAKNPLTHIDFLIYNKVSKKPVLAIETDGYAFHKGKNTEAQAARDRLKDSILAKYDIPLLRLATTGSNEKEQIIRALKS